MSIRNRKRIISTVIAAAVLGGNAFSMLPALPAAAEQTAIPETAELMDSEIVDVIITLDGTAAIDCVDNSQDLDTTAAVSASERAKKQQERIMKKLREQYPDLETSYHYTTLLNAFSCKIPEGLIPYIQSLDGVESVTLSQTVEAAPDSGESLNIEDLPAYYDETGCKGEGQVIAVIDTELNLDHPMFAPLPDDVNVKLKKEDVEAVASGIGLNIDTGWSSGYCNSKVPYAMDYTAENYDIINDDDYWYHGSHVAGIAAGNAYETPEGKLVSGVAPNAQIIFMAMDNFGLSESMFIAAIEDAVKLKADVINISWGTDYETLVESSPFIDAVNAAEEAGVTVCLSAGNEDSGSSYYSTNTADNPDRSMLSGFISEGEKALAVASADNAVTVSMHTLTHNGIVMPYNGCAPSESSEVQILGDVLGDSVYEYEYCGLGYPEDFENKDLTGKLVLVDRGKLDFTVKASNAKAAGAVGVIVVQNQAFEQMIMLNSSDLLMAMVSQENGEILKNAEEKTVSFTGETIDYEFPQSVSSYTSWGVHNTLELRPDIMAFGKNVESASNSDGSTQQMSGTSMASPYIAGCAAILNEYLTTTGCTLTGSERQQHIRNLLMTSAVPYVEDDMFVTPRRQGAGLVSMNRAAHDKVILTGAEGESKLSLRDSLGTQFTFPVTVTNISNEDVTFSNARIALTTDAAEYNSDRDGYLLSGQQPLACTADLGDITEIAAGASRTVNVTVTLDSAQASSLHEIFTNGFFIEGYLLLEGAENCCDVSIPMLGFSDCFADIPLLGPLCSTVVSADRVNRISAPSIFELIQAAQQFDWPEPPEGNPETMTEDELKEWTVQVSNYYDEMGKLQAKLKQKNDTVYISPDHDFLADDAGLILDVELDCLVRGCELLDADGNCVAKPFEALPLYREIYPGDSCALYPNELLYDLPDGIYTLRASLGATRDALEHHPQTIETKVVIDRTQPELISEITEQNGRKILKVTAKSNLLDSIVVLGIGEGKTIDNYEKLSGTGMQPVYDFLSKGYASAIQYSIYDEESIYWYDDEAYYAVMENKSPLCEILNDHGNDSWIEQYEYGEVIHAVPDEDGTFTLEYDITDLSMYHIVAVDKAFNTEFIDYADEIHRPTYIQPGIYMSDHGLYQFTETDLTFTPFAYGIMPPTYHYELEVQLGDNTLTLYKYTDETHYTGYDCFRIRKTDGTDFYLYGTSDNKGYKRSFGFDNAYEEHLILTDLTSPDDYLAVGAYDLEKNYIIPFMQDLTERMTVGIFEYEIAPEAVVTYTCLCSTPGAGNMVERQITVDLKTGMAVLDDGSTVNLLEYDKPERGDVNCNGSVDVADAVLLSRMLAEDSSAVINRSGMRNSDCNRNGKPDSEDVVLILKYIARIIRYF